ncbi:FHA domain-containing protein [Brachybacterium sp. YJGR34]|uniref:FHA domain-containing protein n=1 Tax=Brachybacterium sp. YJGR34 TaxID=2059911 RepID=UPI000E0BECB5|nr:FHA domain-containing protein [Brachybacterium sp. YJGR34]
MSAEEDGGTPELLGPGTWTKQGPATLVMREGAWIVLVPGLRKQVVEAAWELLGRKVAPEQLTDELLGAGGIESLEKLPALLFGVHDGTTATFGVKGTTPIAVHTADGVQQIVGTEEEPFVLTTLEGVRRTAFGELPGEESLGGHRIEAGVLPVRGFVHVSVDPATLEEAERAALAEQVEQEGRSIETPEARKRRAERPASAPKATTPAPRSTPLRRPALATRKPGEMPSSISRGGSTAARSSEPEQEPSGPNLFSGLFDDNAPAASAPATPAPAPTAPAAPTATPRTAAAPATPAADEGSAPASAASPVAPTNSADPAPAAGPSASPSTPHGSAEAARPEASASTSAPTAAATPPSASAGAAATDEPASPATEVPSSAAPRRRLVSTSLFDRPRRPATPAAESSSPSPTGSTASSPAEDAVSSPSGSTETEQASAGPGPQRPDSAKEPAAAPAAAHAAAPSIPTPVPEEDEEESPVTKIAPIDDEDALESPVTRVEPIEDETADDSAEVLPGPVAPAVAPRRRPASPPAAMPDLENSGAYDDLFGKTVFRRVEDAAVRRAAEEEEGHGEEPAPTSGATPPEQTITAEQEEPQSPTQPPPPAEEPAAPAAEFIDWVPGVGRAAPEIARTAARRATAPPPPQPAYPQVQMAERPPAPHTGPRPGAHPNHGPSAQPPAHPAPQPAPAGQAPGPAASPGAPRSVPNTGPGDSSVVTIPGVVCWNGHANSPERQLCGVCGVPLQGPTRPVARPPLGVIELSTGERFLLDRTAIIGRRPRASRVSAEAVPRLITVPSPQQDISRSHLELRCEGWHVVALDLGTTNGTTLHRAGYDAARLRPREGVVLRDGDHLDLGDDVHLRFGERG